MGSDHDHGRHTAMQNIPRTTSPSLPGQSPTLLYETEYGQMILGRAEDALKSDLIQSHKGSIQLVFTSPPFPLNHKKKYGNLRGEKYVAWLASFAQPLTELLAPDGSIVIELGNAWEPGKPVMSTLALEALLEFRKTAGLYLCQQFVCNNPARLPGPAQWVNVERIRVKDSFTQLWWMSPNARPKADNRRVLKPYSVAMLQLLKSGKYSSGKRPSQHNIRPTSFLKDHKGAYHPMRSSSLMIRRQTSLSSVTRRRQISTKGIVKIMACLHIRRVCQLACLNSSSSFSPNRAISYLIHLLAAIPLVLLPNSFAGAGSQSNSRRNM